MIHKVYKNDFLDEPIDAEMWVPETEEEQEEMEKMIQRIQLLEYFLGM